MIRKFYQQTCQYDIVSAYVLHCVGTAMQHLKYALSCYSNITFPELPQIMKNNLHYVVKTLAEESNIPIDWNEIVSDVTRMY